MQELLTFLAKSLVENPDEVKVVDAGTEDGVLTLKLSVAPNDMGKVIGKQGRIAKAIRTVIKAAAVKENLKVNVEIVDAL
ncbi:MAG: KH domain-containing protein [Ruminococcaceae bacterium]|nr:KH domain-containing protein [Oscillospiraceae bacterium]